jgi:dolichol-phosphate mannosyltransferase
MPTAPGRSPRLVRATMDDVDFVDGPLATVVIPTYNERETICETVTQARHYLPFCEVLVVDDDSPDETWDLVSEQFGDIDRVRVLRRMKDHGLGPAVLDGIHEARADVCIVMDADGQHPPERLHDLWSGLLAGADVAIGSRWIGGGGAPKWSQRRRLISKGGALLARFSTARAWRISDPMSGFFAVRRSLVEDADDLDPDGFKILLEILSRCDVETVVEVPYQFQDRRAGESNLDGRETARYVRHMLGLSIDEAGRFDVDTIIVAASVFVGFMTYTPALTLGALFAIAVERAWDLGEDVAAIDVRRLPVREQTLDEHGQVAETDQQPA